MVARSLKVIGTFAVSLAAGSSALSVGSQPSSALHAPRGSSSSSSRPAFVGRHHATAAAASVVSIELEPNPYATATASSPSRNALTMMPATLDRPAVKTGGGGGPAVLDRPAAPTKKRSSKAQKSPTKERKSVGSEAWEVRIYNDGVNTREFVARCLVQVAGLSEMAAYQTMMTAHHNGLAVVGRYPYERAEMYHEALKTNGILCDLVEVDSE